MSASLATTVHTPPEYASKVSFTIFDIHALRAPVQYWQASHEQPRHESASALDRGYA